MCFFGSEELTSILYDGIEALRVNDFATVSNKFAEIRPLYESALKKCPEVLPAMKKYVDQIDQLMSRPDWDFISTFMY